MRRSLDDYLDMADDARKAEREASFEAECAAKRKANDDYNDAMAGKRVNSVSIDAFDNVATMPRGGADILGAEGLTANSPSRTRTYDHSINRSVGSADELQPHSAASDGFDGEHPRTETDLAGSDAVGVSEPCQSGPSNEGAKSEESPGRTYQLRYFGDPCLTFAARPVTAWEEGYDELVAGLKYLLKKHKGIGLAANQVGAAPAIAVMRMDGEVRALVNPRIQQADEPFDELREGSLSIPGFTIKTRRSRSVAFEFQNEGLEQCSVRLRDLEARCAQHLCDQLAGIMIVGPLHSRQLRRQCERIAAKARGWS